MAEIEKKKKTSDPVEMSHNELQYVNYYVQC